ncbi:hypothetical protein HF995_03290 [Sanguibacter hominis ATCC BAA-789]|uniref:Uncharacterized protein n=1 Tax=Sanguibacter hominis ATCC BAA-789 TaxID=1312740 RepID=A0A9X5FHR1_9MICO|nr:hypothetical protein [Sanguibacter hominis]NKX92303.1 hypothetical protein [Sanguibacter hominis ATCC BAA-789]
MTVAAVVVTIVAAVLLAKPWDGGRTVLRSPGRPEQVRSVSVDLSVVTDPATDWSALSHRLDVAGANAVFLNAGRVEFTAFDWAAHPDAAASPGTDHLARAARALRDGDGWEPREIGLIVDAFVPEWIKADPTIAGVAPDGRLARYRASASQLAHGEVGERIIDLVADLGARYEPDQIAITELFLDLYSFGDDDLALFRQMTGRTDWPRDADGLPDDRSPIVGAWRAEVIADLLRRARAALDEVNDGRGADIDLVMEARVDWKAPTVGPLVAGHDYETLLDAADRLVLWTYLSGGRPGTEAGELARALAAAGYDMSRFTFSLGLWDRTAEAPSGRITTEVLEQALDEAQRAGVRDLDVTPLTLMTDADWAALARVWRPTTQ